jgi:hypothetical protein
VRLSDCQQSAIKAIGTAHNSQATWNGRADVSAWQVRCSRGELTSILNDIKYNSTTVYCAIIVSAGDCFGSSARNVRARGYPPCRKRVQWLLQENSAEYSRSAENNRWSAIDEFWSMDNLTSRHGELPAESRLVAIA